jgi:hypothetical protein
LFERRPQRESRHGSPFTLPVSALRAERRSRVAMIRDAQVGSALPADGMRPATRPQRSESTARRQLTAEGFGLPDSRPYHPSGICAPTLHVKIVALAPDAPALR